MWPDSEENAKGEGEQPVVALVDVYNLITASLPISQAAETPWENRVTLGGARAVSI